MSDTTWIRAYNDKGVYTAGEMQAGTVRGNTYLCIGTDCRTSWPTGGGLPAGSEGQMLYNNAGTWTAFSGMYWDDTNNRLGIGTTGPTQKLDVSGGIRSVGGTIIAELASNEGGNVAFVNPNKTGATTRDWRIWNMTGGYGNALKFWRYYADGTNAGPSVTFWDNGNVEMTNNLTVAGNVGIGTTGPDSSYRITTSGGGIKAENASANPAGYFSSTGGGKAIQTGTGTILFGNLAGTGVRMVTADASGVLSTQAIPTGAADTDWIISGTNMYATTTVSNVGIGTTGPGYTLDISGNGIRLGLDKNGGGRLVFANNTNDNKIFMEAFSSDMLASASELLLTGRFGGNVPQLSLYADKTYITGNVGIGTTGSGYKLDVAGDIIANNWIRTRGTNGWYSESYGGGWYMSDTTWIRAYNNKNIYTGGSAQFDGNLNVGGKTNIVNPLTTWETWNKVDWNNGQCLSFTPAQASSYSAMTLMVSADRYSDVMQYEFYTTSDCSSGKVGSTINLPFFASGAVTCGLSTYYNRNGIWLTITLPTSVRGIKMITGGCTVLIEQNPNVILTTYFK
jgi:hypothetical protein